MTSKIERLKRKHEHLHKEVAELEQTREVDRTPETKSRLVELKKEKLHLKDELAQAERETSRLDILITKTNKSIKDFQNLIMEADNFSGHDYKQFWLGVRDQGRNILSTAQDLKELIINGKDTDEKKN